MGRRKIDIQPIVQDRNRSVTFIKRKAGLLKKAYELSVLCQVDVSLIILGTNKTLYEFKSMNDIDDFLTFYKENKSNETLNHSVKTPLDYDGEYRKNNVYEAIRKNESSISNKKSRKPYTRKSKVKVESVNESDNTGHSNNTKSETKSENSSEEYFDEDDDEEEEEVRVIKSEFEDPANNDTVMYQENENEQVHRYKRSLTVDTDNEEKKRAKRDKVKSMSHKFQSLYHQTTNPQNNILKDISNSRTSLSLNLGTENDNIRVMPSSNIDRFSSAPALPNLPLLSKPNISNSRLNYVPNTDNNLPTRRPILRVHIPNDNTTNNTATGNTLLVNSNVRVSTPLTANNNGRPLSSTSSNSSVTASHSQAKSYKTTDEDTRNKSAGQTPTQGNQNILSNGSLMFDKNDMQKVGYKSPMTANFGLHSVFSSFPSAQPYVATPLQSFNVNNKNPSNASQNTYTQYFQKQIQQQVQAGKHQPNGQMKLNSPVIADSPNIVNNGPLTGSLPSKFAHDLIFASPSTSSPMFRDWNIKQEYSPATAAPIDNNTLPHNEQINSNATNMSSEIPASAFPENSGLTPYITSKLPPSATGKYFNFSNEASNDDTKIMNNINKLSAQQRSEDDLNSSLISNNINGPQNNENQN
ncbi:hypothetical protein TPHA_0A01340 [Tetrapisispora phaffii CBS 4417]|uniref:MADS-box domain-containing protein n=1 Tax=Tetrapisispora phaffii (strain ATCC 24235 / CBS 4417 / NBRC 1672 / NRRL Y-8282 / UCD 70-5) TaxID=1071381 RepID=G8BMT9_TETPH|nr:hypothetical protein TPHA_0A01340 [Tetrapisispora phaffii CBS 4417]CCE61217.1 hypothetical protein TPHA_0A01340 [Tetrapisispora phaffii CBS 4417]